MKTKEEILKEYWPELQEGSIRKRILEAMQLYSDQQNKDKDAEIQRLTKEVEELKLKLSGKTFFNPFEQENTRLRELLGEAMEEISSGYMTQSGKKELLEKIDNALNHKP